MLKWRNFAKSGHTDAKSNLQTSAGNNWTLPMEQVDWGLSHRGVWLKKITLHST